MARLLNGALGLNFNKKKPAHESDDQQVAEVINLNSNFAYIIAPDLIDAPIKFEGTLKWNDSDDSEESDKIVYSDNALVESTENFDLRKNQCIDPLYNLNQEVFYTLIPARGWYPTDKNDKGFDCTTIVNMHHNGSENMYTLQGTERTKYEPVEIPEKKLVKMQDTVDYLKNVYKIRNETTLTYIMGVWPRIKNALHSKHYRASEELEESNPHGSSTQLDIIERQNKIDAIKKALGVATVAIESHEPAEKNDYCKNLSEYEYPWNWAYEHWGDNASQTIRDLASTALNNGYDVEWHGQGDEAWLSINGDSSTGYVVSILSQYANGI